MAVTYRLMEERDLEATRRIINDSVESGAANFLLKGFEADVWERWWRDERGIYPWLVAVEGDEVAGLAWAQQYKTRPAYRFTTETSVYLDPRCHGRGIGTELYRRLIPLLEAQGFHALTAGIVTPNPASERLHANFGFQLIGVLKEVGWKLDAWHDVGFWMRVLREPEHVPVETRPVQAVISLLRDI